MQKSLLYLAAVAAISCLAMCKSATDAEADTKEPEQLELTYQRYGKPALTLDLANLDGGQEAVVQLLNEEIFGDLSNSDSPLYFLQITMLTHGRAGDFTTKVGIENGFRLTSDDPQSGRFDVYYFSGPYNVPEIIAENASYKDASITTRERILGQIETYYEARNDIAKKNK